MSACALLKDTYHEASMKNLIKVPTKVAFWWIINPFHAAYTVPKYKVYVMSHDALAPWKTRPSGAMISTCSHMQFEKFPFQQLKYH